MSKSHVQLALVGIAYGYMVAFVLLTFARAHYLDGFYFLAFAILCTPWVRDTWKAAG